MVPPGPPPDPPVWLSATAVEEWRRLAPILAEYGWLTSLDQTAFAALCEAYADFVESDRDVRRFGRLVRDRGVARVSPVLRIRNTALETYMQLAREFFLTPSSRGRAGVSAPPPPDDPAARYLR